MKKIVVSLAVASVLLIVSARTPASAHSTIVVPRDFPSIQAAVDVAAPGDTITVAAGTYTEQVVIGKDLHLRGAGAATIIRSPAALSPYAVNVANGQRPTAIMLVGRGAHVRISNLMVAGPTPCSLVTGIVAVQGATLEVTDAWVTDIHPAADSCATPANGVGVRFGLPPTLEIDGVRGSAAFGRVSNVRVDGYQSNGIRLVAPFGGPTTAVAVADNVITTTGLSIPTEQFGIDVALNAVGQITGNTITGGVCDFEGCGPDPIFEFQAMGVLVDSVPPGTRITGNHVSGTDIGVYQYGSPNCCTIRENTLKDNRYFGIVIQDGDGGTSENRIIGGQVGIGVVAGGADTVGVLRGDKIRSTSVAPVKEIECCGFTATAIIKGH